MVKVKREGATVRILYITIQIRCISSRLPRLNMSNAELVMSSHYEVGGFRRGSRAEATSGALRSSFPIQFAGRLLPIPGVNLSTEYYFLKERGRMLKLPPDVMLESPAHVAGRRASRNAESGGCGTSSERHETVLNILFQSSPEALAVLAVNSA